MGNMGWDNVYSAGGEQVFLSADGHFQLTFNNIGDLFVDMVVFGGDTALFYVPKNQRTGLAVYHFSKKARKCLFDRDIVKVLHGRFLPKVRKWAQIAGATGETAADLRMVENPAKNVDKWINFAGKRRLKAVELRQIPIE